MALTTVEALNKIASELENISKSVSRGVNNLEMLVTIGLHQEAGDTAVPFEEVAATVTGNSLRMRDIMREMRTASRNSRG